MIPVMPALVVHPVDVKVTSIRIENADAGAGIITPSVFHRVRRSPVTGGAKVVGKEKSKQYLDKNEGQAKGNTQDYKFSLATCLSKADRSIHEEQMKETLCQNPVLDVAVNVRESEVATLKLECKALVVDAEQVQDRGIEIMDMNRV